MKILKTLSILILALNLCGCADIMPPSPAEIVKKPLGTESVKRGMTKAQVKDIWGEPDQVNFIEEDERWGGQREEWVYRGRYTSIPVDAGYLSKTKKLYFDGDNLTNIVED